MANVIKHKRGSGSDPVANDLVVGEVAIRTDVGKLFTKMDNGSVAEIAGGGSDIAINTLSSSSGTGGGSATFNGSAFRFTLSAPPSVSAQQLLVSINGVIQKPVAGTSQPSEGFSVDGTDIILGDAPATGSDFFILTFKSLGVSEPADNSVTTAKIVDNNVTEAKLALNSVTNNRVANGAITNAKIGNSAIDTAKLQDDAVTSAKIADGAIVNADINASAAIAGSKISPNFGSQNIVTTGVINSGAITTTANINVSSSDPTIVFSDSDNNPDFDIKAGGGRFSIRDATNNAERLKIDSSGRVMINNTFGSSAHPAADDLIVGATSGSNGMTILTANNATANIFFNDGSANNGSIQYIHSTSPKAMRFNSAGHYEFDIDGNEKVRIDSSGNIGIGKVPSRTLDVAGKIRSSDSVCFGDNSSTPSEGAAIHRPAASTLGFVTNDSERMRIGSSGEVYIGTSNWPTGSMGKAAGRVLIGNEGDLTLYKETNSAGGGASFKLSCKEGGDATKIGFCQMFGGTENTSDQSGFLSIRTSDANGSGIERMRIDSSGNVIIGGTTLNNSAVSGQALQIHGTTRPTLILRGNASGSNVGEIQFADNSGSDDDNTGIRAGLIQYDHGSNYMAFRTQAVERMRIDSSGRLLIGHSFPFSVGGVEAHLQVIGTGSDDSSIIMSRTSNDIHPASLCFIKSRATNIGDVTTVQSGDSLGKILFFGADGTDDDTPAAEIDVEVDGTPGSNDMPGRIVFKTTADGASSTTERMRINSDGSLNISSTTDGSINLSTTDARGSFIRYQISGTTKVFAGCSEGLGFGSEDDFGIRTSGHLRVRTGADQHMVVTDEGFIAVKGLAGSFDGNVDPSSKQYHQFCQTGNSKQVAKFRQEHHAGLGTEFSMNSTSNSEAIYVTGQGPIRFRVLSNGNVANTNNSYGQISDISLKENIVDSNSQWNDIKAIKVRNFNFKADTEKVNMIGVVAQELETVSPKLVWQDRDGLKNVSYSVLYMKAVKCLQEAMTKIETLETKVAVLEAK